MEKLAALNYVMSRDDVGDRVKVAALKQYLHQIDLIESDEEKRAMLDELEKVAWGWGSMLSRIGGWFSRHGANAAAKAAGTAAKGAASAAPSTFSRLRGLTDRAFAAGKKSGLGKSKFFNWAAKHPGAAKLGIGAGIAGGTIIGGGIYGGMKANDAYKKGYGTATAQLSPMVSALYAPQGAMGLPSSRAPQRI